MTQPQGRSMFGGAQLCCGDRSTIAAGKLEGTGREHGVSTRLNQRCSKRHTYISKGILQSTVRLTRWPPTAKTRVCHWLSARLAPLKPQFSVAPAWPLKRKCSRFLESLSPKMSRPRSFLFFAAARLPLLSVSTECFCSSALGSIKVKMYSFRCRPNGGHQSRVPHVQNMHLDHISYTGAFSTSNLEFYLNALLGKI